jgi:hypothetical protein
VITIPASAGPISAVTFHATWLRVSAEGSSSCPTSRGVIAERVGESIADSPAISATAA